HVDRRIADFRVREPAASLVVSDERVPLAEPLQPMAPHGALPVELEMTEPGGAPARRGAAPVHGVRQTHPVRGRAEAHVLLHTPTVPLTRRDREPAKRGTRIADAQRPRPAPCDAGARRTR